jgi:hypothetical protein
LSLGYFKNSANALVVSAGFVKSVGAVFHPVWEQELITSSILSLLWGVQQISQQGS